MSIRLASRDERTPNRRRTIATLLLVLFVLVAPAALLDASDLDGWWRLLVAAVAIGVLALVVAFDSDDIEGLVTHAEVIAQHEPALPWCPRCGSPRHYVLGLPTGEAIVECLHCGATWGADR